MELAFTINEEILLAANGYHTPFLDSFIFLNTTPWVWIPFYVACAVWLYYKFGIRKTIVILLCTGAAVGLADFICANVIRPYFKIMRPTNLDNPFHVWIQTVYDKRGGRFGFPSCHAANVFALMTSILLFARHWFKGVLLAWVIFICFTRMYMGVHYPSDLLGGAVVGSVLGVIAYYTYKFIDHRLPESFQTGPAYTLPWPAAYIPLGILLLTLSGIATYSFFAI